MNRSRRCRRCKSQTIGFSVLEPRNVLASFLPVSASLDLSSPFHRVLLIEADPASDHTIVEVDRTRNPNGSINLLQQSVEEYDLVGNLIRTHLVEGVIDQIQYMGQINTSIFLHEFGASLSMRLERVATTCLSEVNQTTGC